MNKKRILKYASDIHLEMSSDTEHRPHVAALYNFTPKPDHRYFLALCGDIGSMHTPALCSFLWKVSQRYEHVFLIAGNHEFYNPPRHDIKTMAQVKHEITERCKQLPNVHFMDDTVFMLDEYKIIGSTLWSFVPEKQVNVVQAQLNDYHMIYVEDERTPGAKRLATVKDTNILHERAVAFIKKEVAGASNCLLLTHHAPLFSIPEQNKHLCDPMYLNSPINVAFHTDLDHLVRPPVLLWIFGHTHYTSKFIHNGVVVASNQVGYDMRPRDYSITEEIELGFAKQ
ncbi:hypothetical protein SAMD00019534_044020, partial [Acytostelium subglobosum LB1]|uniref:hypothetical protein n=1 Tax=Acytostelium subglobosum LB1 TaxID=1410327 RepID=UPI0006451C13